MNKTSTRKTPLRWLAGLAALAAALVLGTTQIVSALGSNDPSATYTGCLTVSGSKPGRLVAVKPGPSPLRTCTAVERKVSVSGGDLTSFRAGVGLRNTSPDQYLGTTPKGAASVELSPSYRLPQNCATGQGTSWTGTAWVCKAPPPSGGTIVGHSAGPAIVANSWSTLDGPLSLPAGSWAIVAKLHLSSSYDGPSDARCRLDATGEQYLDFGWIWSDGANTSIGVTLTSAVTRSAPFSVTVVCQDDDYEMKWNDLKITAISTDGVQKVHL